MMPMGINASAIVAVYYKAPLNNREIFSFIESVFYIKTSQD